MNRVTFLIDEILKLFFSRDTSKAWQCTRGAGALSAREALHALWYRSPCSLRRRSTLLLVHRS
jgi:hypothetical protein